MDKCRFCGYCAGWCYLPPTLIILASIAESGRRHKGQAYYVRQETVELLREGK
jgi:formate hydrogenlyase subunit 6/NADH:ubiquinone oxidoreductase subunit I